MDFLYGITRDEYIVYDIEVYPNIFSFAAVSHNSGHRYLFEISDRKNDIFELMKFINVANEYGCRFVGFNNIGYDYPVVHFIINNHDCNNDDIYAKSMSIINTDWDNRFSNMVRQKDWLFYQVDLMKIHHFDNAARSTSLKALEFAMRMPNVSDLPFDVGTVLSDKQKDVLIEYNFHDCDATLLFLNESMGKLGFRKELSQRYNDDFTNFNDTKIGKHYFISELEKASPESCYKRIGNQRKIVQTKREVINVGDIVFDYIRFQTPIFNNILTWFKRFELTQTKGAFEYLDVPYNMAVNMDKSKIKVHGLSESNVQRMLTIRPFAKGKYDKWKPGRISRLLSKGVPYQDCHLDMTDEAVRFSNFRFISGKKDESGLNCIIKGFQFDFGTGGIHGSVNNKKITAGDTHCILDIDVKSYYPNIAIKNKLHPAHLGELFCQLYNSLYNERVDAQRNDMKSISDMLKLALNGVYGDSNSQYSPFYDPQYTMAVTINGQLMLCMLAETLMGSNDVEMIQINTDGLTIKMPNELCEWVMQVCQWWESLTKLTLEYAKYSAMFVRDVNNYIAVYAEGKDKYKRKGVYEYERDWHQNHSSLVVQRAANAYLLEGVSIETFILTHVDVYDFMLFGKVPRSSTLELDGVRVDNTVRYYVSTNGGKLDKVMPPTGVVGDYKRKNSLTDDYFNSVVTTLNGGWDERIHTKNKSKYQFTRTEMQSGQKVTLCNNIEGVDVFDNVNYVWYINEAKKLIQMSE